MPITCADFFRYRFQRLSQTKRIGNYGIRHLTSPRQREIIIGISLLLPEQVENYYA
jgi:hypothetical protein